MNILIAATLLTLGAAISGAPVPNVCTINGNSQLSEIKRLSCHLADQRTTMTDANIPSLDPKHLVLGSLLDYKTRMEFCVSWTIINIQIKILIKI